MSYIEQVNAETLSEVTKRQIKKISDVTAVKKIHPYRGFVDVFLPDGQMIHLFCNNDDLMALAYLWIEGFTEEPHSLDLWMQFSKHSSNILDVGSHVGLYSLAAAKANSQARIQAFEAVDYIFARMFVNLAANNVAGRVVPHNVGVSDRSGWSTISVRFGPSVLSKGASMSNYSKDQSQEKWLRTERLDTLVGDTLVDLFKIDVEGHEYSALSGAHDLLNRTYPTVFCEILQRDIGNSEIETLFRNMGYVCFFVDEESRSARKVDDISKLERTPDVGRNFVFIHPNHPHAELGILD